MSPEVSLEYGPEGRNGDWKLPPEIVDQLKGFIGQPVILSVETLAWKTFTESETTESETEGVLRDVRAEELVVAVPSDNGGEPDERTFLVGGFRDTEEPTDEDPLGIENYISAIVVGGQIFTLIDPLHAEG